MYGITETQINLLTDIINKLTVTGPIQGGMLNIAAGTLDAVRDNKIDDEKEGGINCGSQNSSGHY